MALIKIIVTPTTAALDPDDFEIEGEYLIEVDDSLSEELQPSAALDCFHEHVGIKCLDDFSIVVRDGKGRPRPESPSAESYTLGDRAQLIGSECGSVI